MSQAAFLMVRGSLVAAMMAFLAASVWAQPAPPPPPRTAAPGTVPPAHGHATRGPHGGNLIELGDEEYHAELVLDEKANVVTIWLLDNKAANPVVIPEPEIAINLKHGGKGVSYKLKAAPLKGEPAGATSHFVIQDKGLVHALHHKDHGAQLVLKIGGKGYRGAVSLAGHEGHDHDHDH